MKYHDGQLVQLGDRVTLAGKDDGIVVCSIGAGEFTEKYKERDWGYLKVGCLIEFERAGLFHFDEAETEEDLDLIARTGTGA
jgi:ATP-dependent helicase HrpA